MTQNSPKIVVIDDSPTSISLYERSIGALEVDLAAFVSPGKSLSYLTEHDADLVFLDLLMREDDGATVFRELRKIERHRETPVVIVTSKDYAQDRNLAKKLGALEYLVKPLRSQEIREVICRYTAAEPRDGN